MADSEQLHAKDDVHLAADIVSTYVANNHVQPAELAGLIESVYQAITGLRLTPQSNVVDAPKATAEQIKKSIKPNGLISFENGKTYQTLRRHLVLHGLSADEYRAKWGLPAHYPMTSPSYSAKRSELAHTFGLGQQRKKAVSPVASEIEPTKAVRARPKKAEQPVAAE